MYALVNVGVAVLVGGGVGALVGEGVGARVGVGVLVGEGVGVLVGVDVGVLVGVDVGVLVGVDVGVLVGVGVGVLVGVGVGSGPAHAVNSTVAMHNNANRTAVRAPELRPRALRSTEARCTTYPPSPAEVTMLCLLARVLRPDCNRRSRYPRTYAPIAHRLVARLLRD